ncbi:zinc ABC transporter substrate-binding protein [Aquibacillus koreensis]|uniref:Zinc ABC transporter substrate-binding protein n=1 Tax=Aquibacillus koreensis TaxID=279446 RepID=A0A9X3WLG5_9BACI|nr:zinc ABC transporter substrate-binding protein [Aquibacillus koreensis]MCT2536917.1 zinc ABC transporter substrate-binding protein [Aquibacillus koreensis]MDC3421952.1 zinc ABC transporter substrate-binding protein [Aquibacillus koreensis]
MKFIQSILAMTTILLIMLVSGCGGSGETASSNSNDDSKEVLNIYTTIYPLEYFTKEIGGDLVDVTSIITPGADSHTYEPTSKTMVDIAKSDAFIYNGAELETYAKKIKNALKDEKVLPVEAAEGLALIASTHEHEEDAHTEDNHGHEEDTHTEDDHGHEEDTHTEDDHGHEEDAHTEDDHGHEEDTHNENGNEQDIHDHNHGNVDPHVWLDPIRAINLAENIKDTLIQLKPDAAEEFEDNFQNLKSRLEELDNEFHHKLESLERNEILVSHAAYGYWEEAYGIKQIAITGISPSDQPSQKQLQSVINVVREHDIKHLLFEQNVRPKVAEVIQTETGVKSLEIHNLSVLTDDNIENGEDYFTLMYQNLEVLLNVLER